MDNNMYLEHYEGLSEDEILILASLSDLGKDSQYWSHGHPEVQNITNMLLCLSDESQKKLLGLLHPQSYNLFRHRVPFSSYLIQWIVDNVSWEDSLSIWLEDSGLKTTYVDAIITRGVRELDDTVLVQGSDDKMNLYNAMKHINASRTILESLASHDMVGVRVRVAKSRKIGCNVLQKLATDPNAEVRSIVALNLSTEDDVLKLLENDISPMVCRNARYTLRTRKSNLIWFKEEISKRRQFIHKI